MNRKYNPVNYLSIPKMNYMARDKKIIILPRYMIEMRCGSLGITTEKTIPIFSIHCSSIQSKAYNTQNAYFYPLSLFSLSLFWHNSSLKKWTFILRRSVAAAEIHLTASPVTSLSFSFFLLLFHTLPQSRLVHRHHINIFITSVLNFGRITFYFVGTYIVCVKCVWSRLIPIWFKKLVRRGCHCVV